MSVKITYYLDVTSSWCYWVEAAWEELKQRYAKSPVENNIGDRAVFSGFWRLAPLTTAIDSMLADAAAYSFLQGAFWRSTIGVISFSRSFALSDLCHFAPLVVNFRAEDSGIKPPSASV